jgi:phosphoribosylformylglycinamidine (FGAM) synthase PurS component
MYVSPCTDTHIKDLRSADVITLYIEDEDEEAAKRGKLWLISGCLLFFNSLVNMQIFNASLILQLT